MLGAVGGYMVLPLIIWAGVRGMSPYLFVAAWYTTGAGMHALLRQCQDGRRPRRFRIVDDLAAAKPRYLWLAAAFKFEWLLFAVAVTLAEPVVATIVFETGPIFFGLLTLTRRWRERMLGCVARRSGSVGAMLVLMLVGAFGVALAVLSDTGTPAWTVAVTVGALLALCSAFCSATVDVSLQMMGVDLNDDGGGADPTAVSASGNAAAQLMVAPFIAAAGAVVLLAGSSEGWDANGLLLAAAAGAAQTAGNWYYQHANHLSRQAHGQTAAQINALYYLTPVVALGLLALLADTDIARPDMLIVGAAGVVAVNIVMHLDPEGVRQRARSAGRHSYGCKATVPTLWACGALLLLRDDWLPAGRQAWSAGAHWATTATLATAIVLVLAFRQSRLAERRTETGLDDA